MRRFPRPNGARTFPLPNPARTFPLRNTDALIVNPGFYKKCRIGDTCQPFGELAINPDYDSVGDINVTQIRYKIGAGGYSTVSAGSYPDIIQAAKFLEYSPTAFGTETYTLEVTATNTVREWVVTIDTDIYAGRDKIAQVDHPVKPFADAIVGIVDDNIATVEYSIDGEVARTSIPAGFGTDLILRVVNFEYEWASSGERRVHLYIEDDTTPTANEATDFVVVRV